MRTALLLALEECRHIKRTVQHRLIHKRIDDYGQRELDALDREINAAGVLSPTRLFLKVRFLSPTDRKYQKQRTLQRLNIHDELG